LVRQELSQAREDVNAMKWDLHVYDPKTQTTKTLVREYPGTKTMADSAAVCTYAARDLGVKQKYILAVPHRGKP